MKKAISIILIALMSIFVFAGVAYADSLDTIDIKIDKQKVNPGEEVKLTIEFGQNLGAYTFDISYDNNIFEYISADGGTANDTSDKVKVTYYDQTGGTNPRTNMSITFKAKENITTSNPTELTVTGEGLANADASVSFDDITTPIVKNLTVEPNYVEYTFRLESAGDLIKEIENEMILSYSSPMGHYYEHARLVAESTTPQGAKVQLVGTDSAGLEHDIIQSGWGDAQGYKIGGKDVEQVLQTRATFSQAGNYTITLKLIDRDNLDAIIAQKSFDFTVAETSTVTPPATTPDSDTQTPNTPEVPEESTTTEKTETSETQMPTKLPKTGNNIFVPVVAIIIVLGSVYVFYNKEN